MTDEPASILVADDDAISRLLLVRLLEREGHTARTAENGREALDLLRAERFDVVLLDILMPELDGISVLEQLKLDPVLQHIPVIMISALDDVDSVVHCIENGAEDHLPKPFDSVLLRARINAGLMKKRLHDLERDRVRDVFARFLPEPVVDELLESSDGEPRLGGVRLTGTVLFCDLRGFTTFAEATSAETVIEALNTYLTQMSDAILDHGGTLVSYMGDGIMAVFGAPIERSDHADRCLAAAREMLLDRLPRFNTWLRENDLGDGFDMGIGIATGPIMSGNVGSTRRLEYTTIGDTTNTASRIEAMTKGTAHQVLMAESTVESLTVSDAVEFVGEFEVRGRQSAIRLWTLSGGAAAAGADAAELSARRPA
jgi:class 3 adenylate cyclase